MADLFRKLAQEDDYSAQDIEVLEGLEPVRKRPGAGLPRPRPDSGRTGHAW